MNTTKPLRRYLRNAVLRAVLITACFAAPFVAWQGSTAAVAERGAEVSTYTETLLSLNDCWTGSAPADMAGKLPGAAVVTMKGENAPTVTENVAAALDKVFGGKDHGIYKVHGFCR